jgi:hypothetical protein
VDEFDEAFERLITLAKALAKNSASVRPEIEEALSPEGTMPHGYSSKASYALAVLGDVEQAAEGVQAALADLRQAIQKRG